VISGLTPAAVVSNIMAALNSGGSVMAFMEVYADFFSYISGVYTPNTTTTFYGGHAVRIIGYGTLNNVDYWLCANSWGTYWGEKGFFRIRRGVNAAYIEGYVIQANF